MSSFSGLQDEHHIVFIFISDTGIDGSDVLYNVLNGSG